MKLVTFTIAAPTGRTDRLGALLDADDTGRIVDLGAAFASHLAAETDEPTPREYAALRTPPDMIGWLRGGDRSRAAAAAALDHARRRLAREADPRGLDGARLVYARDEVGLKAPIPRPRSFRDFSVYAEHMANSVPPFPKKPAWYRTPPYYKGSVETFIGPDDPIPFPYYTTRLDLEIEIAIVIGREGRNLTVEAAKEHIAGYAILIDPSCRDGYEREPFGPTKRKDFCTVLGPCLVTADAIDEADLRVRVAVDGETWFEGTTAAPRSFLAHHLVAYASDNETIYPGDVLATGTIGTGCSMDYGKWPAVGQTVEFEVEGIGRLRHRIVAGEHVVDHVAGMDGLLRHPVG